MRSATEGIASDWERRRSGCRGGLVEVVLGGLIMGRVAMLAVLGW